MATPEQLFRINDALTTLAEEMGVDVPEAVLDDLTHHVAAAFDLKAGA
jgi:hypothetical protein